MLGPTVNAITIIACGLAGCFLIRGIPDRVEEIIRKAIGLFVIYLGVKGALENQRVLLLIMSLVTGSVLGELIGIDSLLNHLGDWAEKRLGIKNGPGETSRSFSKAFISTSILFCGGSMATIGSIQSGLLGNHDILFSKSIIDGITSVVFAASMGIGVVFSAIPVFLYQSFIALTAMALKDLLTADVIREMSAVGSLVIAGIGFNFLGVKEIKVANFIPAIFVPLVYMTLEGLIRG